MNAIETELICHKYKDNSINKWVRIYKNTKKNRVKNKQFSKILPAAIKERKIIKCDSIVLLDIPIYTELKEIEKLVNQTRKDTK